MATYCLRNKKTGALMRVDATAYLDEDVTFSFSTHEKCPIYSSNALIDIIVTLYGEYNYLGDRPEMPKRNQYTSIKELEVVDLEDNFKPVKIKKHKYIPKYRGASCRNITEDFKNHSEVNGEYGSHCYPIKRENIPFIKDFLEKGKKNNYLLMNFALEITGLVTIKEERQHSYKEPLFITFNIPK